MFKFKMTSSIAVLILTLQACSGGGGAGNGASSENNPLKNGSIIGQLIPDAQAQQGPVVSNDLIGRWNGIIHFGDTTETFEINLNGDGSYNCSKTQTSSCFLCNSSGSNKTVEGNWKVPTKRSVTFIPSNRGQALAYWNHPVSFFETSYVELLTTCNGWLVPMILTKN